ncbi:MAG: sugar kinase, partial [Pseudomonadota bacterium]
GSTGWLRSVLTGARSIEAMANGRTAPSPVDYTLPWDTSDLIYCVREPFPSKMSGTTLAYGTVNSKQPLEVTSHMATDGVIFSDGVQSDAIPFETGSIFSIGIARQQAHLVVQ